MWTTGLWGLALKFRVACALKAPQPPRPIMSQFEGKLHAPEPSHISIAMPGTVRANAARAADTALQKWVSTMCSLQLHASGRAAGHGACVHAACGRHHRLTY